MLMQPDHLTGKVALVTGAARRVGRAVALALAQAGMDVAITFHRSRTEAAAVSAAIRALGRRSHAIEADLGARGAIEYTMSEFGRHFDRLDALINNASTFEPSPLGSVGVDQWDRDMAVNARAPFMLTQACAAALGAHYDPALPSSTGRVVNFIDIHVLGEPLAGYASYNASKAALMEMTATCALELAPRITVNAIAPGVVDWATSYGEVIKHEYMKRVPLARAGTPQDAATAVLFLVRDAHYCTGQVLKLDGGRSLT
jgi:pteridine reductase